MCGTINYPAGIETLDIDAEDAEEYDIFAADVPCAMEFLDARLKGRGQKVLVHCFAGMNRSVTVCAAWILKEQQMSLVDTVTHLAHRRGLVLQNLGFLGGL